MLRKIEAVFVGALIAGLLSGGAHASADKRYACERSCLTSAKEHVASCRAIHGGVDDAEVERQCPALILGANMSNRLVFGGLNNSDQALLQMCMSACIKNNPDFESSPGITSVLKLVPNMKPNCDAEVTAEVPAYCE